MWPRAGSIQTQLYWFWSPSYFSQTSTLCHRTYVKQLLFSTRNIQNWPIGKINAISAVVHSKMLILHWFLVTWPDTEQLCCGVEIFTHTYPSKIQQVKKLLSRNSLILR
jgi:hypothetical protein